MKVINIIGHPVLVMSMYLLIMISGEHFGGFYLIYILMGLAGSAPHAMIALSGLAVVFTGYKIYRVKPNLLKPVLYILGISIMGLALIVFFEGSKGYNDGTFYQTVPIISLILFGITSICFLIHSFWLAAGIIKSKGKNLSITL